jgi:type I restriction enzyme S subunit
MSEVTVPDGWKLLPLKRVFELQKGSVNPANSPEQVFRYYSLPGFDEIKTFQKVKGVTIESNKTLLKKGCVLVSKLNPRKSRVMLVEESDELVSCASTEFMSYIPKTTDVDLPFYKFYFDGPVFNKRLQVCATGSTNSHVRVSPSETLLWKIFQPPLPEQQKIASILTSVDDVIEKTQSQINKLQDLKKGTMDELLTRGIGHTEFKGSPLGGIPKEWEVSATGRVAKSIVPGRNKPKVFDGDIPWITISDIDGIFVSKSKSGIGVSREALSDAQGKTVPENTVIMTVVGEFGLVAISERELVINQQLHGFVCGKKIDSLFLYFCLIREKGQMEKLATQTTISYMNKDNAESVKIPLPPLEEQKKIASILTSIEKNIEVKQRKLEQTKSLKKSLMRDLLSGKVRVYS